MVLDKEGKGGQPKSLSDICREPLSPFPISGSEVHLEKMDSVS